MQILCTVDIRTRELYPEDVTIAAFDHLVDDVLFVIEPIDGFQLETSTIKIAAVGPLGEPHDYEIDPSTVTVDEETGNINFIWSIPVGVTAMPLTTFKISDTKNITFAVCAEIVSGDNLVKAWHSDDGTIKVKAHLEPESGGGEDPSETATNAQKIAQLQTDVAVINTQVGALANGSPTPVATVAEMTDESAVYLYTGSESGYTAGNWYFWNDSAWTSGGTYGGAVTDTTLSISGKPADAKAVGDALAEKADSDDVTALDTRVTAVEGGIGETNEQLSELESELNVDGKAHVSADYTVIPNSQVSSSSGVISESPSLSRSDYTDLQGCEYFTLTGTSFTNYCVYDADKIYISGVAPGPSGNIQRPSNAKYIIFTVNKNYISEAKLDLYNCNSVVKNIYDELDKKAENSTAFGETFYNGKVLLAKIFGVTRFPGNLVDIPECVDGYYISAGTGNLVNNSGYFCTGYIPVVAGSTYKANHGRAYAWYDSNKEYISGFNSTDIQTGITAPDNSAYIRFSINKSTDSISDPFALYFSTATDYKAGTVIDDIVVTKTYPWCYEKKINWIGDSIVAGPDFDEEVCSTLGLIKENEYGIDGSTISLNGNSGDARNAICVRYTDMSNDADIIVVSAGTNDWMYAWAPIGSIDDPDDGTSNRTFYGALKALCKGLIDKYPNKVIFFTTPIKRAQSFENGNGGEYTQDGIMTTPFSKNKYGKTLGDYADIIKEVCGYYSIPVLDMYRESLLNPHIASQQSMFDSALTHPNATGRKIMARRICGWITQLGYIINGLND